MAFWTLLKREIGSYFVSPVAYVVLFALSITNGYGFLVWASILGSPQFRQYHVTQAMFSGIFFWFALIFLVPVITMRVFSEEFKLGTMEMILTAPVREWDIVLAKFFGAVCFYAFLWSPTILYIALYQLVSGNQSAIVWGPTLLSYLMTLLLGMFYISIGVFTSALTKNQIIAAVLSFTLIFFIFCLSLFRTLPLFSGQADSMSYVSAIEHMDTFSGGLLDTRPIVFYISGTLFFVFLTQRILHARRLKA
jgi:ABC-2 type transport system permease protein